MTVPYDSQNPPPPPVMVPFEEAMRAVPGLESASTGLAGAIHELVLRGGPLTRRIADALHGVWFGHPLHPALTDIPIGAWVLAGAFDLHATLTGDPVSEKAADRLTMIGVAAAVPTALAGVADYSAIKQDAAPTAFTHGVLNSAALGLYLLSLGARSSGRREAGTLLSALALAAVGASAALGGDLVYRLRVGVNHSPGAQLPDTWTDVIGLDEIPEYEARRVEIDDVPVLLYRDADDVHAIGAVCNHAGGPLEQGTFDGHCVECPWHQSVFDLRDGRVVHGPATQPQPRFEARVRDGRVELRAPQEQPAGMLLEAGTPQLRGSGERHQTTQSIIVGAPIGDVYALWANFENFPRFMENIESVTRFGERESHWVMAGPLGSKIEWDAETTRLEPNTRIAWNSRDGGDITTSGQVIFTELPSNQTQVTVTLQYVPPAGAIGEAVAQLFVDPDQRLAEDLRRFKDVAEGRAPLNERARGES